MSPPFPHGLGDTELSTWLSQGWGLLCETQCAPGCGGHHPTRWELGVESATRAGRLRVKGSLGLRQGSGGLKQGMVFCSRL